MRDASVLTLHDLFVALRDAFRSAEISEADLDARILVSEAAGLEPKELPFSYKEQASPEVIADAERFSAERLAGKPVGRILGYREFWGLRFALNDDTLEPRPDTETLIETVLQYCEKNGGINTPWIFADVGVGTGAIIISLLHELPNARAVGVDLSLGAVSATKQNAISNGVFNRLLTIKSSYLDALGPGFDFIVSNPPYIRSEVIKQLDREVSEYDPALALDGGASGLDAYRVLISQAKMHLKPNGNLFLEIGWDQADALRELAVQHKARACNLDRDLAGNPRVITVEY